MNPPPTAEDLVCAHIQLLSDPDKLRSYCRAYTDIAPDLLTQTTEYIPKVIDMIRGEEKTKKRKRADRDEEGHSTFDNIRVASAALKETYELQKMLQKDGEFLEFYEMRRYTDNITNMIYLAEGAIENARKRLNVDFPERIKF